MDGLSKPHQIANRCLEIGATSCALTDHGSISGAIQFYSEMNKKGIKPILGCEIYVCDQDASIKTKENGKLSHLLILAKNLNGWKDLIKVISISNYGDNFYKKPRLDLDTLGSIISKNMLCITGHLGSSLANTILDNDHISSDSDKNSNNHLNKLIDVFGRENIFLESQLIDQENLPIQVPLTSYIRDLGKKFGIKVICTPDAHYCRKEDAVDQRILLCNNLKTTLSEINRKLDNDDDVGMSCFFTSDNFHIPTFEEMKSLHTEEEIQNTLFASSMCEEYDIMSKPMLPPFDYPKSYDSDDEYVRQLCRNGWKQKLSGNITKEQENIYADRIKYELGVLQGAGLSSYFLIVNDIVNYVKDNNWLPGPGRGSAAGCLVSYLLGITSIDPIKYNLMFDRFYNAGRNTKDRISMPDIDIDVPINKREDIINYIKNKYGHKKVSQMITFNTMKGRGALKDVLRAYGNVSFDEMNKITKFIPDEAKIADELQEMKEEYGEASIIQWALENNSKDLKEWCYIGENDSLEGPLAKRFEQAIRLEGTKSNQSKHAAGVVIASNDLENICPMVYDTKNKQPIAGMEMQDLESIGIIKFDVLGVAMLDKIMDISSTLKIGDSL